MNNAGDKFMSKTGPDERNTETGESSVVASLADYYLEVLDAKSFEYHPQQNDLSEAEFTADRVNVDEHKFNMPNMLSAYTSFRYRDQFRTKRSFTGWVTECIGEKTYLAEVQDKDGSKFEYEFEEDFLPRPQRKYLDIGASIIVYSGVQYRGQTRQNSILVFINPPSDNEERTKKIVESWDF